jgi:hypothetical protein
MANGSGRMPVLPAFEECFVIDEIAKKIRVKHAVCGDHSRVGDATATIFRCLCFETSLASQRYAKLTGRRFVFTLGAGFSVDCFSEAAINTYAQ